MNSADWGIKQYSLSLLNPQENLFLLHDESTECCFEKVMEIDFWKGQEFLKIYESWSLEMKIRNRMELNVLLV